MQKLILFFVLGFATSTFASDLREKVAKTSGFREGEAFLKADEDEDCQQGTLAFMQAEGESGITLMLGAHPLAYDLGVKTPPVDVEEGCTNVTKTARVKKGLIETKREQTCNGITTTYLMTVKARKDGFEYHRKNFTKGQVFIDITCAYTYEAPKTDASKQSE